MTDDAVSCEMHIPLLLRHRQEQQSLASASSFSKQIAFVPCIPAFNSLHTWFLHKATLPNLLQTCVYHCNTTSDITALTTHNMWAASSDGLLQVEFADMYTERNVAISGIHTHSGPGGYLQYVLYDITSLGFVEQSWEAVVSGIVEVLHWLALQLDSA